MKIITALVVVAGVVFAPSAQANQPKLSGYICVDQHGVHHLWQDAFNGSTYCKLIPNPNVKATR